MERRKFRNILNNMCSQERTNRDDEQVFPAQRTDGVVNRDDDTEIGKGRKNMQRSVWDMLWKRHTVYT
jgi:hypothetical protein